MIEVKDLKVRYNRGEEKVVALEDINLTFESGVIYGVIGPSGCGKSTLIKVLSGIIDIYEGEVSIGGEKLNPKVHSIGLVPQNYGLLPWKRCYDNIVLASKIKGRINNKEYKQYVNSILKDLKIEELVDRYPKELSGGQRQRVSLARTFVQNPDVLLLDEAFSALDAITSEHCQKLFLETWDDNKVTTIIISHSVDEIAYLAQKVIMLSPGPGRILKIIDNTAFHNRGEGEKNNYYDFALRIRQLMKEEWKNESVE